jgi:hypothetical protein
MTSEAILPLLIGVLISVVGFFGARYFTRKDKTEEEFEKRIFELDELKREIKSQSETISRMGFALKTQEEAQDKFKEALWELKASERAQWRIIDRKEKGE